MAFVGCLLHWSASGLGLGLELARALGGGRPLEPLASMFWAMGFAMSLLTSAGALALVWPAVSALRGSGSGRFLLTLLTVLLVAALAPWLGYWEDWPILVTATVGLALLWAPPTSEWLSEVTVSRNSDAEPGRH